MGSLLDEGISKPLDGSVSTPQALPPHSPPCHADCKICIFYEVTVSRGEKLVFIPSIFAFTVPPNMHILPCKAMGPPNATGHQGQIDTGKL